MPSNENEVLEDVDSDPGTDEGESVTAPDDATDVAIDDSGGATITLKDEKEARKAEEFYENLAETMSEAELGVISNTLMRFLDEDKQARKERDKQYAEGLQRTGLGNDAPGGASFEGASKVVHPMLTKVAIDFEARSIKELFPAGGPAKDFIPGKVTKDKLLKAKRKMRWLNFQLTTQMPEFRDELEQLLTQLSMAGACYMKFRYDELKKRPVAEFIPIDNVFLPFTATNFYQAERKTHVQNITEQEFKARIRSGMFRDVDLASAMQPDETSAEKASQRIEGKRPDGTNIDNSRTVYEIACQYHIEEPMENEDGAPSPYLISIDETTKRVVSVYRNWDEGDKAREELVHIAEFVFVPWRGAQGIGLPHMIGGLSAAATGALRALLDSALINNFPGGVKMKAGPMGGQNVSIQTAEITELDGAAGLIDDIRKLYMNVPVNPPSDTLVHLLGFLVDAGNDIINTTLDEKPDSANVPVGTQLARIEQGMVVFSAIHARMHAAMGRILKIMSRINATYLDDEQVVDETGEQMVTKDDFDGPMDVIPVSDPNIFSEMQRFAQIQTIAQRSDTHPGLYDAYKVEQAILERLKVPHPSDFLVPKPEPQQMNAVNENVAMSLGHPVVAFPLQDQLAHLQTHLDFLKNPLFGMNSMFAVKLIPAMIGHITEHILFWYAEAVHEIVEHSQDKAPHELMNTGNPELDRKFDQVLARAASMAMDRAGSVLGGIPQVIQQAQQLMQQLAPPPQMQDPNAVKVQTTKMQTDSAQSIAAQNNQTKQAIADKQTQSQQTVAQTGAQSRQAAADTAAQASITKGAATDSTKVQTTQMDNLTAETIAGAELAAGKGTHISTGEAIGGKGEP